MEDIRVTRTLRNLGMLMLSFPFLYPLTAWLLLDVGIKPALGLFLQIKFWVVSGVYVLAGYGLLTAKKWAWPAFISAMAMGVLLTYIMIFLHSDRNTTMKWVMFLGTVVPVIGLTVVAAMEMHVPYLFPRIPWWESDPRYKFEFAVSLRRGLREAAGDILDISPKGCFIRTNDDFVVGETLHLTFTMFGPEYTTEGEVMFMGKRTVTRPKGIGIRFLDHSTEFKQKIKQDVLQLKFNLRQATELKRVQKRLEIMERQHRDRPLDKTRHE